MSDNLLVRTTFQPTIEILLTDQAEYDYLKSAGLLVLDQPEVTEEVQS